MSASPPSEAVRATKPVPRPGPAEPRARYALASMAPEELHLAVERLWTAHGPAQRLRRLAAGLAPPLVAARLAPTRRADDRELDWLRTGLTELGRTRSSDRGWVLVTDAHAPRRGRLVCLRVDRAGTPREVLKLAASPRGRDALRRERDALEACDRLPSPVRDTLPRVLGFADSVVVCALSLTALDGRSQYVELHADLRPARRYRDHFRDAARWLAAFHGATRSGSVRGIPLAAGHGDYWPGNVLLGEAGVQVVDWESFAPRAPVTDDLLGYLVSYAELAPGPGYRKLPSGAALRRALLGTGSLASAASAFLGSYCEAMGVERRLLDGPLIEHLALRLAPGARVEPDGGPRHGLAAPVRRRC